MLDSLESVDKALAVGSILFKEKTPDIYKAKVKGNVQLRPRLCFGPQEPSTEVTFLQRVSKKDGKENPPKASQKAAEKMPEVAEDPKRRWRLR